jgi:xanthine dehydrogenase accessory factor
MTTQDVRLAVILGTNEIASAIGVYLHRAGYRVVLSHDPNPPVMRRKMAFHDALFADFARVENVIGERVDDTMDIFKALRAPRHLLVTWLGLLDLLPIRPIDVLIDARMQKRAVTPDLRGLTRLSIGLGPGFSRTVNCDIAIETHPARNGLVVHQGWTDAADGKAMTLGGVGSERFAYSSFEGRWHTAVEIGTRVYRGFVVGHLSGAPVTAPHDGLLRGIIRDGSDVPAGVKLLEVDPRGRLAQWTGIDERGQAIAQATLSAIEQHAVREAASPSPEATTVPARTI